MFYFKVFTQQIWAKHLLSQFELEYLLLPVYYDKQFDSYGYLFWKYTITNSSS